MCGRFALTRSEELSQTFGVEVDPVPPPRYNIAPSQPVGVLVDSTEAGRQFRLMKWGLIPSWAKDPKIGNRLINARSETAREKPSFWAAFKRRRCLIPADGYYEWKKLEKSKQPYYFQIPERPLFAFAGLWESWQDIETCTILTMEANPDIQAIHHRMPVILHPDLYNQWLDSIQTNGESVQQLILDSQVPLIESFPVSTVVNSPSHDTQDCVKPLV